MNCYQQNLYIVKHLFVSLTLSIIKFSLYLRNLIRALGMGMKQFSPRLTVYLWTMLLCSVCFSKDHIYIDKSKIIFKGSSASWFKKQMVRYPVFNETNSLRLPLTRYAANFRFEDFHLNTGQLECLKKNNFCTLTPDDWVVESPENVKVYDLEEIFNFEDFPNEIKCEKQYQRYICNIRIN